MCPRPYWESGPAPRTEQGEVRVALNACTEALERYNITSGRLVWHNGIPPDEIWIKVGGDKGGGSFKAALQILNLPNPNSPLNTCVFACFEAGDSTTIMHICLDRYSQAMKSLHGKQWL